VPIVENYMPTNNPSVLDRTSNVGVVAGCLMGVWSLSELIRLANVAMSAIGTKRTYRVALHMSAIGGKADTPFCAANVR
jgi:hypothetical protein